MTQDVTMALIDNPILPGFNPDPSICRVGDDYYIATSTFEWFPGVQIHHSKDLVHWRLLTRVLTTTELLDMRGMDNSEGVYAPALSYADGRFWLCFSNVHSCRGFSWMATPCFVTSAEDIQGPWSAPVPFGNYGFDPSLFHDDDGRKYMVNMQWDGRKDHNHFAGILLQQFDAERGILVGPVKTIFAGTELGCTEGPQILKKDGYYYLITAEGGTEYRHAVTVARSRSVWGPYEVHPDNPLLTSHHQPQAKLQRAGHGFLVETQGGEWYLSHLCGRPLADPEGTPHPQGEGFSILGRESALQRIRWRDGWPYLAAGGRTPQRWVEGPDLPPHPWPVEPVRDEFNGPELALCWQTLREPVSADWLSLSANPGHLRLIGRHYLYSRYQQSLVARRWQAFHARARTEMRFAPEHPMQMAGLVVYYARGGHYLLKQSVDDQGQALLQLVQFVGDQYDEHPAVSVPATGPVQLEVTLDHQWYRFRYSLDGEHWQSIGPALNSTPLSDEGGNDVFRFTGTMVGLFACDLTGQGQHADFDWFEYQEFDAK